MLYALLHRPASVCPPTTLSVRLSPAQMSQPQVQLRVPLHARYPAVLDKADSGVLDSDVSKSWYSELLSGETGLMTSCCEALCMATHLTMYPHPMCCVSMRGVTDARQQCCRHCRWLLDCA